MESIRVSPLASKDTLIKKSRAAARAVDGAEPTDDLGALPPHYPQSAQRSVVPVVPAPLASATSTTSAPGVFASSPSAQGVTGEGAQPPTLTAMADGVEPSRLTGKRRVHDLGDACKDRAAGSGLSAAQPMAISDSDSDAIDAPEAARPSRAPRVSPYFATSSAAPAPAVAPAPPGPAAATHPRTEPEVVDLISDDDDQFMATSDQGIQPEHSRAKTRAMPCQR